MHDPDSKMYCLPLQLIAKLNTMKDARSMTVRTDTSITNPYVARIMTSSRNNAKHTKVKVAKVSDVITNAPSTLHCNIYDFKHTDYDMSNSKQYECVRSRIHTNVHFCLYPTAEDVYVSGSIRKGGEWAGHVTRGILQAFKRYPNASFLDLGANIGLQSLVVARTGRKVVAVEPKLETVKRLHKSVNLNNFTNKITLVKNAVSDKRRSLTLYADGFNQGASSVRYRPAGTIHQEQVETIVFDDLLEVLGYEKEVVIKMDIEGSEARALNQSQRFFSSLKVQAIFMEWQHLKTFVPSPSAVKPPSAEASFVYAMVAHLRSLGFQPRVIDPEFKFVSPGHKPLQDNAMNRWPNNDIVWVRPWPGIGWSNEV